MGKNWQETGGDNSCCCGNGCCGNGPKWPVKRLEDVEENMLNMCFP